jgi:hypothetical protein
MLDDVIKAYLSPDKKTSLESALSKVDDLDALVAEANAKSAELATKAPEDLTDDDVTELQGLAEILKSVREARTKAADELHAKAEKAERAEKAEQAQKLISDLGKPDEPVEEAKPKEEEPAPPVAEAETPQESPAMAEPVVEPVAETKELVGAGVGAAPEQFSVSSLQAPVPVKNASQVGDSLTRMFSVDNGGSVTNRKYENMKEVGDAVISAFQNTMRGFGKNVLAQYKREEMEEFSVYGRDSDSEVIDRVAAKLPEWDSKAGQFAAGWCAPSETLYELCPFVTSLDGIVDLPEVLARRGGVQTTNGPNFATLFANASIGQVLTEAQVIAGTPKTCIEVDCPPFVETRLDVNPLCITGNLLTQAGYPEYVERFIREAIAANEHKINLNVLLRMVAASTAVTLPGATGPVDTSSASWFLDAASLYATWLRDRYRLRQDALIEVVAPYWYFQQMYSDLARRNGVDLLTAEARLRAAFAERNIRVQWVYDWQPMSATAAGAAARPTTVQIMVFIPGTFVKLTSPVINLGTIHSAAQLTLNQYTALFVEEGFNVLERCFESLVLTVPTCPSGTTGAATGACDSTP